MVGAHVWLHACLRDDPPLYHMLNNGNGLRVPSLLLRVPAPRLPLDQSIGCRTELVWSTAGGSTLCPLVAGSSPLPMSLFAASRGVFSWWSLMAWVNFLLLSCIGRCWVPCGTAWAAMVICRLISTF